jgi:hypothetical protein
MRTFRLNRKRDVAGVSGTGVVAQGVLFDNGKVALTWLTTNPSVTVHDSMANLEAVHCHGGATVVEWLDGTQYPLLATPEGKRGALFILAQHQHQLDREGRQSDAICIFSVRGLLQEMWKV